MPLSTTVIVVIAICSLLILSAAMRILSQYTRIPFTVLLIVVGILLSYIFFAHQPYYIQQLADYNAYPDILLYVCLPTLIFEAAFTIDSRLLRRNLFRIMTISVPGVLLCTLIFGLLVGTFSQLGYLTAFLLGAILSATDSVAVISIFRQLGVPKKLSILVEGESLFNSATGFVLVSTILYIMTSGMINSQILLDSFNLFVWNFLGGIATGLILAWVIGIVLSWIERQVLIEISLVIILAYLSFIVAEKFIHVSGIMSTITAGIVMAGWGRTKISSETEGYLSNILSFSTYIVNALIFLLVGFSVNLETLVSNISLLLLVIFSILIARAAIVFGLLPVVDKLSFSEPLDASYKTIMWFGGLQGSIGLTLVMTSTTAPHHNVLITLVMGVVLFTILVQGSLMVKLISWLHLDHIPLSDRLAKIESEILANQNTLKRLPSLKAGGLFSYRIAHSLQNKCEAEIHQDREQINKLRKEGLNKFKERILFFITCFSEEKSLYSEMYKQGNLSENSYKVLAHRVDIEIDSMRYQAMLIKQTPLTTSDRLIGLLSNASRYLFFLSGLVNYFRTRQIITKYEEKWALHQTSLEITKNIDEMVKTQTLDPSVIDEVKTFFSDRAASSLKYLNDMAEQFPEFVNDIQSRFAQRLFLYSKYESIIKLSQLGSLPQNIAVEMQDDYLSKLGKIRHFRPEKLDLDPHELLRSVPFFNDLNAEEANDVISMLKKHNVAADEIIIKENDTDKTFYIILRGVIRVYKENDVIKEDTATLMAGDFFGEMSLLYGTKRTASCVAITPSILYTLSEDDFKEILKKFPRIQEKILEEANRRAVEND